MCGIAGFIALDRESKLQPSDLPFDWTRMVDALIHRGPDESGFYTGPGVGLGMRRLSVIDLAGGHQPLTDERETLRVMFNGEVYNYRELRAELEQLGHCFYTSSDTETLIHGYEEWGDEVVQRLRSMFAFALWDEPRKRLLLARDHFGIKPLFYTVKDRVLWFASEIKALLQHPKLKRELDAHALDQYLSFLYIPAPRTIYRDVYELPPGHRLVIENGHVCVEPYWKPRIAPHSLPIGQARELVAQAFEDSVRAQLVSDVPLGAFLSGGIDSASIVAMMKRHTNQTVKTFSLGFGSSERNWDETEMAERVAVYYGTDHRTFRVEPDVVGLLPQVVAHFDQPFANPTSVLMLMLARETRKHVTVALAGTGGDELFAGYPRYKGMLAFAKYQRAPAPLRRTLAGGARAVLRDETDGRLGIQRVRRFLEGGAFAFDECYMRWMSVLSPERRCALYSISMRSALDGADPFESLRAPLNDPRLEPEERLFCTDFQTYLPFNQLAYADRMSMAASLEVRVPFVDQVLFEAVKNIPLQQKLIGNQTKGLFRQAMAPFLPPFILDAPKMGLNLPIANWIRGPLRPWLDELVSPQQIRARGLFDVKAIQTLLEEHDTGKRDNSLALWALAVLEVWQTLYMDADSAYA